MVDYGILAAHVGGLFFAGVIATDGCEVCQDVEGILDLVETTEVGLGSQATPVILLPKLLSIELLNEFGCFDFLGIHNLIDELFFILGVIKVVYIGILLAIIVVLIIQIVVFTLLFVD